MNIRLVSVTALMALAIGAGAALYVASVRKDGGETRPADIEPSVVSPTPAATSAVTPTPTLGLPEIPDTSQRGWWSAYRAVEDAEPRYNQEIAGITIGPEVGPQPCLSGAYEPLTSEAFAGSALEPRPAYLPEGTRQDEFGGEYASCDGVPAFAAEFYYVPGTATRHAGFITLTRRAQDEPAYHVDKPAERIRPGTIAGLSAAIVEPMLPEPYHPWTESAVVVWDEEQGMITAVETVGLTLDDTIRIAEGLFTR